MKIKLTESKLRQIVNESVRNILSEAKSLKRKGTIEMNGERIDAIEDKLDRNGNPTYKVNHPSVKGRKDKNGYTRVQSYTFKPTNESINKIVAETTRKMLREFDWDGNLERYYAEREKNNPYSPNYQPSVGTCRVIITNPIYDFVKRNFDWDTADDFREYLEMDDDVWSPYAQVEDDKIEELYDEEKIINYIQNYENPQVAQAVIKNFDDIVMYHKYDENNDYIYDEEPDYDYPED